MASKTSNRRDTSIIEPHPLKPKFTSSENVRLIFFDTETTGLNLDFDQILQFAAVMTDDAFREIDRFEVRCRRLPWVVPSPTALLVTGVKPEQIDDPSLPTFVEMMNLVRQKLESWSPGIFIGYNSMRFDEPLLQRAFWQTLNPPYLTVTSGNGRADLLPIVQAASHLAPGTLSYPVTPNRRTGFKLDALAPINGFAHNRAHDALGDVEATIFIARLVCERSSELWRAALARARGNDVARLVMPGKPVLVVEYLMTGPSLWWGCRIDDGDADAPTAIVVRLDRDWGAISRLSEAEFSYQIHRSPKSVREISLNSAPMVFGAAEARSLCKLVPEPTETDQAVILASSPKLRSRIFKTVASHRVSGPQPVALEQRIFEGNPNRADNQLMELFHALSWPERAALVRKFEDGRYRQLAQRLVFVEAPDCLDPINRQRINRAISKRLHADHGNENLWRTFRMALAEVGTLRARRRRLSPLNAISNWILGLSSTWPKPSTS